MTQDIDNVEPRNSHSPDPQASGPDVLGGIVAVLTSVKFSLILLLVITLACVAGTILPQGDSVAKFLEAKPGAENFVEVLRILGFTHVFTSLWFTGLLCLLVASLSACTWKRMRTVPRLTGRAKGRAIGSCMTHVSLILVLLGGMVRGMIGVKGFLPIREGQTLHQFRVGDKLEALPFSVQLKEFEIEYYGQEEDTITVLSERLLVFGQEQKHAVALPVEFETKQVVIPEGETAASEDALRVRIHRRVEDFVIDIQTREVETRSAEYRNPAIHVETVHKGTTNTAWLFAFHPEFNMHGTDSAEETHPFVLQYEVQARQPPPPRIKDYRSSLAIIDNGRVVLEKKIEVNLPLSYKGFTLYQSGYDPRDPTWTSLQVVSDPGVPLVYLGFSLMILGLLVQFYIYPREQQATQKVVKESGNDDAL